VGRELDFMRIYPMLLRAFILIAVSVTGFGQVADKPGGARSQIYGRDTAPIVLDALQSERLGAAQHAVLEAGETERLGLVGAEWGVGCSCNLDAVKKALERTDAQIYAIKELRETLERNSASFRDKALSILTAAQRTRLEAIQQEASAVKEAVRSGAMEGPLQFLCECLCP
jgi:hypothetical protein